MDEEPGETSSIKHGVGELKKISFFLSGLKHLFTIAGRDAVIFAVYFCF